jgi:hypothetical protein
MMTLSSPSILGRVEWFVQRKNEGTEFSNPFSRLPTALFPVNPASGFPQGTVGPILQ